MRTLINCPIKNRVKFLLKNFQKKIPSFNKKRGNNNYLSILFELRF